MKRLSMGVAALGILAGACVANAGSLGPGPSAPSTSAGPSTKPSPDSSSSVEPIPTGSPSPRTFTYQVWLSSGTKLFVTRRTAPFTPAVGRAALESLLSGASDLEHRAGVGTSIPAGSRLLGLAVSGGVATVDLSREFRPGGGDAPVLGVAQIVYTITQFSTVRMVVLQVDGADLYETAQTRQGYTSRLPAILVDTPTIGSTASSPVTVSGTANVFEATVSVRILDAGGRQLASTFTTATCGTGCRGTYSVSVPFPVTGNQPGTIEVFEASAKDGSPINVVRIPVVLSP
jgi:immunoglobulin-like protein involved in spore germination/sporulation and spore germination protein